MQRSREVRASEFNEAMRQLVEAHPSVKLGNAKIVRVFGLRGVDKIRIFK